MAKSKSTRALGRKSRPEAIPRKPELARALQEAERMLNSAICVFTCAIAVLQDASDVGEWSNDAARALTTLHEAKKRFGAVEDKYDDISLRIAHEGIPAQFPKGYKLPQAVQS